jgi:uncharacterized RDD family membrane protein YckC
MLDNELAVETPEHVELHFVLASIGNRFLACAIDHIIQLLLVFFISLSVSSLDVSLTTLGTRWGLNWVIAAAILTAFIVVFGYFIIFETIWSGQTPGKRWTRLRVVRLDGRPISFYEAMIRNLVRLVDLMPLPSYFVGIASIFFSQEHRRLGDYAAGTVVVKERSTEAPSFSELFESDQPPELHRANEPASAVPIPTYALRLITKDEMKAVDAFLQRRTRLESQRRQFLAYRIAAPLMIRLQLPANTISYESFLEELHRQYTIQAKYLSK